MGNGRTDCCMIISVSAGGKHEQKSLRDREGPHRSLGLLLNHFWMAVTHYALLSAPHHLFIQPFPGEHYNQSVLQHVCVCWCGQLLDPWTPMLIFIRHVSWINSGCMCVFMADSYIVCTFSYSLSLLLMLLSWTHCFVPPTSPAFTCSSPRGGFATLVFLFYFFQCSVWSPGDHGPSLISQYTYI